ncbi:hypothetical protein Tco_0016512 [Tanacetum coccineum]
MDVKKSNKMVDKIDKTFKRREQLRRLEEMFGSSTTGHVKIRGGKTKGGRLIPAQRLGRMGSWLGMDGATSDTIEET